MKLKRQRLHMKCACEGDNICRYCVYMFELHRACRGLSGRRTPDSLDSWDQTKYTRLSSGEQVEREETEVERLARQFVANENRFRYVAATLLHDLYYEPWTP